MKEKTTALQPGIYIRKMLKEKGISVSEFALRMDRTRRTVYNLFDKTTITPEIAASLELVLGVGADYWLELQRLYDGKDNNSEENPKAAIEWMCKFPTEEMEQKGWINKTESDNEKVIELLRFFGFSSPKGWENYYLNKQLKGHFPVSLLKSQNPYAISCWLRRGEIASEKIEAPKFNKKEVENLIPKVRNILFGESANYLDELSDTCLKAGVKVVYVENIGNTGVHSALHFKDGNPVIQIEKDVSRHFFNFSFFDLVFCCRKKNTLFIPAIG